MKKAVIAGCGYVGRALAIRLLAAEWQVWGVRRSPQEPLSGRFESVSLDLCDTAAVAEKLRGAQGAVLFYLATADKRDEAGYRRAYVDGLVSAVEALRPGCVLFGSSTSVYGQRNGELVDEESATEPTGFSGQVMLEAEAIAIEAGGVAVRYGGIYGPGRTRLIDRISSGYAIASADGPQYRSRIHRDDCAAAMAHLAHLEVRAPRYVAVDDEPTDQRDVQDWLCQRLGQDPSALVSPTSKLMGANKRCSNALLRSTGYRFIYSTYRDGYGAMLAQRAASLGAHGGHP